MTERIATPIGLFKAGPSGVGGDFEPMTPMGIRHDFFQRLPEGIVYGLEINTAENAPSLDTMIIDVTYDAHFTLHDPHHEYSIQQVSDYPVDHAARGMVWFCGAQVPHYTRYSKVGEHTITISVAPRTAPAAGTDSAHQILSPRDFSPEAGGVTQTFKFRIYDEDGPAIPTDEP